MNIVTRGYEDRVLGRIIETQAKKYERKPFFYFADKKISYLELNEWANRAAHWFSKIGVKKGDKVCIMLPNSPEFFYFAFGLAKIGAIIVPLNIAHKGNIFQYMINNSDAEVLAINKQFLNRIKLIEGNLSNLKKIIVCPNKDNVPQFRFDTHSYEELLACSPTNIDIPSDLTFSSPVAILYTSGTTGVSKGVVWSNNQSIWIAEKYMEALKVIPKDIYHGWGPVYHVAGFCLAVGFLITGGGVALVERFSASKFWEEVRKYNATISLGFITTLQILYTQPEKEDDIDNPLRAVITGGVPKSIADDFEKRFGVVLVDVYGSTEFEPISYSDYKDRKRRSMGKGINDVEVRIVDEYDRELPPYEVGEIVAHPLKPYIMMSEYYKMPEKTIEAWRNLWFHTEDYGYKDEDGYIYFVDRRKDRIRRRGENVSSHELETIIMYHPAVAECAVVGVAGEFGEDDIKAVIRLEKGEELTHEELLKFCEERIAYFMVPRFVEFVDHLPKSAVEKIEKEELKKFTEKTWDREKAGYKLGRD